MKRLQLCIAAIVIISVLHVISASPYPGDPTICNYRSNEQCEKTQYEYSEQGEIIFEDGEDEHQARSLECKNGEKINICCNLHYASEQQAKQWQKLADHVQKTAVKIGPSCTNYMACMISCGNSWKLRDRHQYPEILPNKPTKAWDFEGAYMEGESLSCYRRNWTDHRNETYTKQLDLCDIGCKVKYSECERDKQSLLLTKYFVQSSRIFNQVGMWLFSAMGLIEKDLKLDVPQSEQTGMVLKQAFQRLHGRISTLDSAYRYWADTATVSGAAIRPECKSFVRDRFSVKISDRYACGEGFLGKYKAIDPQLVEGVNGFLDYQRYKDAMNEINATLFTYDFRHNAWMTTGDNEGVSSVAN